MQIKIFYVVILLYYCLSARAEDAPPPFEPFHPEKLKLVARLGETRFRHADYITAIVPRPEAGQLLLASRDGTVRLWDEKSGAELRRISVGSDVWGASVLPDNRRVLVSGSNKLIGLWDLENLQLIRNFQGHEATVFRNANFAMGKKFLAGSGNGRVRIWDIEAATFNELKGMSKDSYGVAVSPDGKLAAACGEKGAWIWNAETAQLIRKLDGLNDDTYTIAFSPDSRKIATCSGDKTFRLWNADSGKQLWSVEPGRGRVMAFSPLGDRLVLSIDGDKTNSLRVFKTEDGTELLKIENILQDPWPCCFSHEGKELYGCGSTVYRWDAESGKPLDGPAENSHAGRITKLELGHDGALYSLGSDRRLIRWDVVAGAGKLIFSADREMDNDMTMYLDQHPIVAGFKDHVLQIWDAADNKKIHEINVKNNRGAPVFIQKPDRIVIGTYEEIDIFDGATTNLLRSLKREDSSSSWRCLTVQENVLALGFDNGTVKFWDLTTGAELEEITVAEGDRKSVTRCAFFKGGTCMLAAAEPGVLSQWTRPFEDERRAARSDLHLALKQLGDDDFNAREAAVRTLVAGGDKTAALLASEPESKDPEIVRLMQRVRAQLRKAILPLKRAPGSLDIKSIGQIVAHPDGERFALTCGDGADGQLLVGKIEAAGPQLICRIRNGCGPAELCFSIDGTKLFVGNRDSTISVYQLEK